MKLIRKLIIYFFLIPSLSWALTFKSDGTVVDSQGNVSQINKNDNNEILSQFEKDLERISKDNSFIDKDGKVYSEKLISNKSNIILMIYTHGASNDQTIDKCLSGWAKVPSVIRNFHNQKIKSHTVKIYRLCSGVRGWTQKEQDRMWKAHKKLGKIDEDLKASDGSSLISKQKQNQKLIVIKNTLDEFTKKGFNNIILAGHSSGGWQSLKLKSLYPKLIDGVIGLNPGAGGSVQNRKDWPWWEDIRYYGFGDFKNLNALIITHDKDHFNSSKDYSKFSELKFVKKINLSNSDCKPESFLGNYHGITLTNCYAETELKNNNIKNYLESLF